MVPYCWMYSTSAYLIGNSTDICIIKIIAILGWCTLEVFWKTYYYFVKFKWPPPIQYKKSPVSGNVCISIISTGDDKY